MATKGQLIMRELQSLRPEYFTFTDSIENNISRIFIITNDGKRIYTAFKNTVDHKQEAQRILKVIDGKERNQS